MNTDTFNNTFKLKLKSNEVLCLAGDNEYDLYYVLSGKLMVCVTKKTQVIPVAYLDKGQYIGEISFFDHRPRSATVIATEDTEVVKIPPAELKKQVPKWLVSTAIQMITKLRETDDVIQENGIRKKNVESIRPLSIDDQRMYYSAIEEFMSQRNK
ncbi:MAG: cyclic nucleotide-binding domain-containing protein [Bacteriovoracaceae bacterium]|nr:cyclic nucleotide-binding domain-containing protein [Bacteriovoracaceae bacterium]